MEILFEDKHVIVAVKPRGVLSEHHVSEACMPRLLADSGEVYPVHRLDRAVGGVMVYAKTKKAAATLSAAIQRGDLVKEYTAIVAGELTSAEGELRDYLFKDAAQNKSFVVSSARKGAKEAILRYRVQDTCTYEDNVLTRVQITLMTGRSHQIRVQFASRSHPLIGDGKYGSRYKAQYPALFATTLSFPHPVSGEMMRFSTPFPRDFPWDLFGSSAYEIERKYLIAYPDTALLAGMEGVRIKRILQTYLAAPEGVTQRVRSMEEKAETRYVETLKRRVSALRAVEEERELTAAEYEALLERADPARRTVAKTRYCIPHGAQTLEVDVYDFWTDRATVEVELTSEEEAVTLPPYLTLIREVTEDKRYKNVNLARELPDE